MKRYLLLPVAFAALRLPLVAMAITPDSVLTLHTGDTLIFDLDIRNYQLNALLYGAPLMPSSLNFLFVTSPTDSSVQFQAGLESLNGEHSLVLPGTIGFVSGNFDSSENSGTVSMLEGSFSLSSHPFPLLRGGGTVLYLKDLGGDVMVGLPPFTIPQDLYASAAGGHLSVGPVVTQFSVTREPGSAVPEPRTDLLLIGGGVLLCAVGGAWRKLQPGAGRGV